MEVTVKVYDALKTPDDKGYELIHTFKVNVRNKSAARKAARAELEKGYTIRSVNIVADEENTIVVYVAPKRKPAKTRARGKPVVHTGMVGQGRKIRDPRKGR